METHILNRINDVQVDEITTTRELITPEIAAEYLKRNTFNRPLIKRAVKIYADTIRKGQWLLTSQGISFNKNGELIDGQHRLSAIIEADMPVEMLVFRGVSNAAFQVLDTGKNRNAGQILAMAGVKSAQGMASVLRWTYNYDNHIALFDAGRNYKTLTNKDILQRYLANPVYYDLLNSKSNAFYGAAKGIFPKSAIAIFLHKYSANQEASDFIREACTITSIKCANAAQVRNFIAGEKISGKYRILPIFVLKALIYAYEKHLKNSEIQQFRIPLIQKVDIYD
ncbi:MAG: hypothetical protein IKO20_04060 [Bacteroidaceae bacterium]|nr:hypothetical protein [Bacteroidaceae bacterium]